VIFSMGITAFLRLPTMASHQKPVGADRFCTLRSAPRFASPYPIETLFYRGEPRLDERLELGISENIWPIIFDPFANEFADIARVDALRDAFASQLDLLLDRRGKGSDFGRWAEARGQIAPRVNNLSPNPSRT
jgi:hypothetical protein